MRFRLAVALIVGFVALLSADQVTQTTATGKVVRESDLFQWNRYHTYAELTDAVQYLAVRYRDLASLESAGKSSAKQRDIWILTITNSKTGPASNIAGMQSLHHYAGAILRPFCNLTDDNFPPQDLVYYDYIANRGREITNYGYIGVLNDFTGDPDEARYGVQIDWGYLHVGVITFTTEQWRYAGNIGPTGPWRDQTPEEQMARNDREFGGKHFVNWKPVTHPQYGDVEIGGWIQFSVSNPPADIMEAQILIPNMRFILYHASTMPLVRVSDVKVTPREGVYRITATIENQGLLPTNVTEQAIRAGIARPLMAKIELGPGVSLVSGSLTSTLGQLGGTPPVVKEYTFGSQAFGGANRKTAEWIVSGKGEVTVTAVSQKAGTHARRVTVGG